MHPNVFLNSFWRPELRNQVFVAMSFHPKYQSRYEQVFTPAIKSISVNNNRLQPFRTDISKSGDSILSEITDGIAHSTLVLADVSTHITIPDEQGKPVYVRNANVMYELGLALACRHHSEVLIVRDDEDPLLFDLSSVPHLSVDFSEERKAIEIIRQALLDRLNSRRQMMEFLIAKAISSLHEDEMVLLGKHFERLEGTALTWEFKTLFDIVGTKAALTRLVDKGLLEISGFSTDNNRVTYKITHFGTIVFTRIVQSASAAYGAKLAEKQPSE